MAKQTYSVTVDEKVKEAFQNMCKADNINQSMIIEAFMRTYINKHIQLELVNNKPETFVK